MVSYYYFCGPVVGRVCRNKAAHFMKDRRQRKRDRKEQDVLFKDMLPVT
jgi:hypothetical protein